MYNQTSLERFEEKVGYELWYLKYIAKTQDIFEGGEELTTVEFDSEIIDRVNVDIKISEIVGIGHAMNVIEAISPLTFVSAYKIIDMIFEWILEVNLTLGNINKVPWQYSQKVKILKEKNLQYPSIMISKPYLGEYLFALYDNLAKFRHEIIHNNHFLLSNKKLKVETIDKGVSYTLEMDEVQMGALVRLVIAYVKLLLVKLQYGPKEENLMKCNFDMLSKFHGLTIFGEDIQVEVEVIYNVLYNEGVFLIDLMHIRKKLKQIFPESDAIFNLNIFGYEDKKQTHIWKIPAYHVPDSDQLKLTYNDFLIYKI